MADDDTTPADQADNEDQLSDEDMESVVGGFGSTGTGAFGEAGVVGEAV